ncbi:MAG: M42 family metallopeptidase [Christensenellaceae bacterium]|nr:M42 family metallopeptidase [Christensenellaceae bacterium]
MDKKDYLLDQFYRLAAIPSPTGMTHEATAHVLAELTRLGFQPERTRKGTVVVCLGGVGHPLLLSAHVDTLGAVVRAVKGDGHLRYSRIGGFDDNNIENENVRIHTRDGKVFTGTVYSTKASGHVWGNQTGTPRSDEFLEIILDEEVSSRAEVEALGIHSGDFISFDPRTVITDSGYVKSRHIDDKASAAVLLTLAREVAEGRVTLGRKVYLSFTVYEEVGHGGSGLEALSDVEDMLAVDMGCVGADLSCKETQVSICAKDSAGPYDWDFTNELIARCRRLDLDYAVDVYPSYSSDASPALKAGMEIRFALCGQGVFASHGYERTHVKGMLNTLALVTDTAEHL